MPNVCRLASATQKSASVAAANNAAERKPRPNRFWRAPGQYKGQREHENPAHCRSRHPRQRVHHEVHDDAPDSWSNDQPLRQRDAVVRLSQRHAHNDVADACERDELSQQKQQSRNYRRIDCHRYCPVNARRAATGRRLQAEPGLIS